ncbi:MAG: UDP-N-acetylmuramoyl-L-alanine--D-glutamate ligase [Phycisphaerales bacterium]|nr:UDP-N-acetylmuramoyl-L-alanine--D-glutamate ligase [Phycisphaerales bacterium]
MPEFFASKKVLVMGLGRFGGGVAVTKWLAQQGAIVTVTDAEPADKLTDSLRQLDGKGGGNITFKLGGHHLDDFLNADLLVINPAVDKQKSPIVRQALARGIPFTTEMNLFLERCLALTIGITGSVGKSTTTTLIHESLKAALTPPNSLFTIHHSLFPHAHLGGNIGKSLLPDLPNIRPHDLVVLELSSFMLEDTPAICWSPNIAVITNLFANHLDRHDTFANYSAAKQNILRFQKPADVAIFNADHDLISRWPSLARGQTLTFSTRNPATPKLPLLIPGDHNQSNAQAALAVLQALQSRGLQLDLQAALHAITHFPGLSHRLQLIHTLPLQTSPPRALHFYNDSKATSPDASITALNAFDPRTAIFLVGGYDKHIDLSHFEKLLAQRAGAVLGLGATGQAIVNNVKQANTLPENRVTYVGTLEAALPLARDLALTTPTLTAVVLSPASASWDQFPNYEKRGETFTKAAQSF